MKVVQYEALGGRIEITGHPELFQGAELEEFPGDADRIRFIWPDGSKGQWFSRRWPMPMPTHAVLPKR